MNYFLLSLSLTLGAPSLCQTESLTQFWNDQSISDSIKFDSLEVKIQTEFQQTNADSALYWSEEFISRAKSLSNSEYLARGYYIKAISYATVGTIDSALVNFKNSAQKYESLHDTTNMIKVFFSLGTANKQLGNSSESMKYYNLSQSLSEQTNYLPGISKSLYAAGVRFFTSGKLDSAYSAFYKSAEIQRELGNKMGLCIQIRGVGDAANAIGNSEKALEAYLESIELARELNADYELARSMVSLSTLYTELEDYTASEPYIDSAIIIFKELGFLNGISHAYMQKGGVATQKKNYKDALQYFQEAEKVCVQMGDIYSTLNSRSKVAFCYYKLGTLNEAEAIAKSILVNGDSLEIDKFMAEAHNVLGQVYLERNILKAALFHSRQALSLAQLSGSLKDQKTALETLYGTFRLGTQPDSALFYLEKSELMEDSILSETKARSLMKKSLEHEFDKKALTDSLKFVSEKKVLDERNEKQKTITGIIALASALSGIFILLLFRLYKKVRSQKEVISESLEEKDTLLREIHHRVKNNLQVVSSLLKLQTKSTTDAAAKGALKEGQNRVQSMSLIHKNLYSKDNLTGIRMKDYLKDLCQNLVSTYSLVEGQVTLHLDIEDINLDVDSVVPIGLIMNELITNALKYAYPNEASGNIYISLKEIDATLCIMVKDDGIGISNMENIQGKNSFGYRLINSFSKKLNATINVDGSNGTQVDVCISEYERKS
ncbi:MAG: histidine kinase dimerization/phosphoacceptor domain -containing protein [Flavobacteriales bacterium]